MPSTHLENLKNHFYEIDALRSALHMMHWDLETYMPENAGGARAEHIGLLSRLAHEKLIDPKTHELIEKVSAEATPNSEEAAMARVTKREFDLATKIPTSLVEEKAKLSAQAHEIWVQAKAEGNFKKFEPYLQRMFEIAIEEANYLGYKDHPYDALIDQYEEGATTADCKEVFESIKQPLITLVKEATDKAKKVDQSRLIGNWDETKMRSLLLELLNNIGFDLKRGRLDKAAHPFCSNFSVDDVRLTTWYISDVTSPTLTTLHEAGHGMYEQGSPEKWNRTPLAGGISLGVHESQSRLWENIIGRSKEFWIYYLPKLKSMFPEISDLSLDYIYQAVNKVTPSFIRVESDELTYNLHVLIRFEIETDVISGKLQIKDIPQAWNDKMKTYLGIIPESNTKGCLQDVHWSNGYIGYFPTYTMGNLLSYQIWNCLKKDIPNTAELIQTGQFAPILKWLQEKIYNQGKRYTPKELVQKVTGGKLGAEDYLQGLTIKYKNLYA